MYMYIEKVGFAGIFNFLSKTYILDTRQTAAVLTCMFGARILKKIMSNEIFNFYS